jgi:hypothetical protein
MMIWGGLLYLKNFDLFSVYRFSRDRDLLIDLFNSQIISKKFRYIPNSQWGRNKYFVYFILHLYWMIGKFNRVRPIFQNNFKESDLIKPVNNAVSLLYEEGFLKQSDSRFVLDWILNHQTEYSMAMNYCAIRDWSYNNIEKDHKLNRQIMRIKRTIINN